VEKGRATAPETTGGTAAPGADAGDGAEGGASRSQHVVLTLPQDFGTIPQFLHGPLERLDRAAGAAAGPQLLIVTADPETALAVAEAALAGREGADPLVLPVTRPERAARQLAARPALAVAGTPSALAALVRGASVKLGGVRTLVLAWADAILQAPDAADLDALLAEVPREAARVLVASEVTGDVEALVERAMRRPRRVDPAPRDGAPVAVSYVTTAASARPAALRRVLDELDPVAAAVVVASDESGDEVARTLRALGYPTVAGAGHGAPPDDTPEAEAQRAFDAPAGSDGPAALATPGSVTVVRAEGVPAHLALAVLYDVPSTPAALARVAASAPGQLVALVQPRQLLALRAAAGGPVRALALNDAARRARSQDELVRAELRMELERGLPPRELAVLEPVLAEFDPAEVAAAALRLLDRERARARTTAQAVAAAAPAPAAAAAFAPSGMTRLFVSAGSRDNVRPGDLVGAIAGEAGIAADKLGKIDVRESFSLVEVQAAEAERVIAKVTGISIRGRRVQVRPERDGGAGGDRGGPPRGGARAGGPGRPGGFGGGDRPDRGPRPGGGGRDERGGERRGPSPFGGRGFTDGPRGFGGTDDRGVAERSEQRGEWAERAERLRNAQRKVPGAPAGPGDVQRDGGAGGAAGAGDITES
jgi:ATP-dependent RNA helicase DeaD